MGVKLRRGLHIVSDKELIAVRKFLGTFDLALCARPSPRVSVVLLLGATTSSRWKPTRRRFGSLSRGEVGLSSGMGESPGCIGSLSKGRDVPVWTDYRLSASQMPSNFKYTELPCRGAVADHSIPNLGQSRKALRAKSLPRGSPAVEDGGTSLTPKEWRG